MPAHNIQAPPDLLDLDGLRNWMVQELRAVSLQMLTPELVETHNEPLKPQHGRLYFADGTDWDPGSGRGVYAYDTTGPTWRFLG